MSKIVDKKIQWICSVPIFRNSVILKQLGIAIGIPFGFVIVFILISSGINRDSMYAIGLIVATILLSYLFIKLLYGGKYEVEFTLDKQGVHCYSEKNREKKNRIVNGLTVMAGILSKKPAVSGAGILANTKINMYIQWDKIRKVNYNDNQFIIIVKGGLTENIALFCTSDNYSIVKNIIRGKTNV